MHPGRRSVVTDICVPISHLPDMIEAARSDIAGSTIPGAIIGHVGDGNFHAQLMVQDGNMEDLKIAKNLANRMAQRALAVGGTISGEHGIGQGKRDLMEAEHGAAWDVMGEMKHMFDPRGILNPGKLIRD
jgi:D-lactate dehydrogenase (cytochrome)